MAKSSPLPRILRPSNLDGLDHTNELVNPDDLVDIDPQVGAEIRGLRRARDTTLAELSEKTGLSQGYLSQVERGISQPSIKALHSISRALGVTISWFFSKTSDENEDHLRDTVVRANRRRKLAFSSGITDELLSPNLDRQIELLRCIFPPGSASGEESYSHQGEEAGFILSGSLTLWIDDHKVELEEGDSFAFQSDRPHRYANTGDRETIVIWAITPPSY